MNKKSLIVLGVVGLVVWLGAGSLRAQAAATQLTVTVAFPFTAGKATLPAGEYIVERDNPTVIHIHNMDTKAAPLAVLMVETRLGAVPGADRPASLVFDHVGEKYVLSEVWLPGEDGYLVSTTRGTHTHEVLKGK
jgi:hypothetical protein